MKKVRFWILNYYVLDLIQKLDEWSKILNEYNMTYCNKNKKDGKPFFIQIQSYFYGFQSRMVI